MRRYIDADRLIRRLENRSYKAVPNFIKMINEQEAADVVEVKHGRWKISVRNIYGQLIPFIACSICGKNADDEYAYCPNCGAQMDLEEDE